MKQIKKNIWDKLGPPSSPFHRYEFLHALESSGCLGMDAGWLPMHQLSSKEDAALLGYIKGHSYGEYIFDWSWAEAYERMGIPYYPKLTSMTPFTPVSTAHFLMPKFNQDKALELLSLQQEDSFARGLSSLHYLFLLPHEKEIFQEKNYLIRESIQYHFINRDYQTFDDYLLSMKPRRAKVIRKERKFENIEIKRWTTDSLSEQHAQKMYQFYRSTIEEKNSFSYLNESFFQQVFLTMKDSILYVEASREDKAIAGSLFFYDEKNLYGRYWGASEFVPNLHFELSYYQGIEFCIEKNLQKFEAGAQGEHKIQRGFRPSLVYSAHKLQHPGFHQAVGEFVKQEKIQVDSWLKSLDELLPFRKE